MAKTVLYNGKIYVERGRYAQALLQEDGFIRMVGSDEEVLASAAVRRRSTAGGRR